MRLRRKRKNLAEADLVGCSVMPHCGTRARGEEDPASYAPLHDFWELGLGETFAHEGILEKYMWSGWDAERFVKDVERWLSAEKRLLDLVTGEFLLVAAFVEVDKKGAGGGGVVTRVVAQNFLGD